MCAPMCVCVLKGGERWDTGVIEGRKRWRGSDWRKWRKGGDEGEREGGGGGGEGHLVR